MWQHVAGLIDRWGEDRVGASGVSSLGAVVGATHPEILETVRSLLPRGVLLLPGVGAQGGSPEYLAAAFTAGPASALVSASRSRPLRRSRRGLAGGRGGRGRAARRRVARRRRRGLSRGPEPPHALGRAGRLPRGDHDRRARRPRRAQSTAGTTTRRRHHDGHLDDEEEARTSLKRQARGPTPSCPGDTLASIATKTGTTVATLKKLNPGIDPTALRSVRRSASSNLRFGVVHRQ